MEFGQQTTHIYIDQKQIPGNVLCFNLISNDDETTVTSEEMKDLVFGMLVVYSLCVYTHQKNPLVCPTGIYNLHALHLLKKNSLYELTL